ncbi:helix-turn-helix domain-containing protein [Nonomuraea sp. CA-143628]|uniref:helix-turn-helix domain-containing protein n=1 Tax=Nonomuraea sp. CA-143628 TaxID=3239997 RepID=UPI003D94CD35
MAKASEPESALVQGDQVDPAAVQTVAQLAAALDRLRRSRSLSYAGLERAARPDALPRSTVSDLLRGETRSTWETVEVFLRACEVAKNEWGAWHQAWQRAGSAVGPAGAVRVERAQPRHLGVHAAIDVLGAVGPLPFYVERDTDTAHRGVRALLREAMPGGGMVVLVGGSSVGKTRCAYEALVTLMPQWWLLHPTDAAHLRTLAAAPPPKTVVWLDELQRFLQGEHRLDVATVRMLLQAGAVLVATLWPERHAAYTTPPLPAALTRTRSSGRYWSWPRWSTLTLDSALPRCSAPAKPLTQIPVLAWP